MCKRDANALLTNCNLVSFANSLHFTAINSSQQFAYYKHYLIPLIATTSSFAASYLTVLITLLDATEALPSPLGPSVTVTASSVLPSSLSSAGAGSSDAAGLSTARALLTAPGIPDTPPSQTPIYFGGKVSIV